MRECVGFFLLYNTETQFSIVSVSVLRSVLLCSRWRRSDRGEESDSHPNL